ncbi:MAG: hypothetical protein GY847_41930 [Proteobacteria bacterium]|nr:hypothetical protein [Pseudomonadota bacterium]
MREAIYQDSFPKVTLDDIRRLVGGRRALRRSKSVVVHLLDGRVVEIFLGSFKSNIAGGLHREPLCPRCNRRTRTFRVIQGGSGLVCRHCLRKLFGAPYQSQEKNKTASLEMSDVP